MRTLPRRTVLGGASAATAGIVTMTLPAAAAASSTVLTTGVSSDGLAVHLDATSTSSWSAEAASSGTGTWTDLTGGNRSIPAGGSGQPTFRTSGLGIAGGSGAFDFAGTAGATTSTALPAFAYGTQWTVAAWVRFADLDGWQNIVTQGDSSPGVDWSVVNQLYFQKSSHDLAGTQAGDLGSRQANQLGIALERGTREVLFCFVDTPVTVGRWHHVVATGTATQVTVHLDGGDGVDGGRSRSVLTDATWGGSLRTAANAVSTRIGSDVLAPTGQQLHGAMGLLQVWTRALDADEVAAHYTATRAPYHGTFTTGLGDADLVMHLDAADRASWVDSGDWTDVTGNGRSLTPGGAMSFSDTGLDITDGTGAFVFDGTGGRTPTAAVPAFGYGPAWSIAAWVRHSSLEGWQCFVGHGDRGVNAVYFQKALDGLATETTDNGTSRGSNRLGVSFGGRGGGYDLYSYAPTAATTGVWYHVVVTASADAVKIHVDGQVVATAATESTYGGSLAPATEPVTTVIGNRFDGVGDPLRGALAFLQIWTRALTDAEVAAQYAATKRPYHGV